MQNKKDPDRSEPLHRREKPRLTAPGIILLHPPSVVNCSVFFPIKKDREHIAPGFSSVSYLLKIIANSKDRQKIAPPPVPPVAVDRIGGRTTRIPWISQRVSAFLCRYDTIRAYAEKYLSLSASLRGVTGQNSASGTRYRL